MKTTNILYRALCLVLMALCSVMASGQSATDYQRGIPHYIPASPTVSSLMQYADCPVSYYTGVPDISIPLYEIDVDGYKLPVTLSYHASGIRADQEASWVGLGWSLHAGGAVSRTVRCADDFLEYHQPDGYTQGYYDGAEVNVPTSDMFETVVYANGFILHELKTDSEPDVFSYSLPGGSGRFLLDKSRGAVLYDKAANVRVEVFTDAASGKKHFRLTAPDGVQYEFNARETTSSYQRSGSLNRNLSAATKFDEAESALNELYESPRTYTSAWYLTKITTVTGREIAFSYTGETHLGVTQESCRFYNALSVSGGVCGPGSGVQYSCSKTVTNGLHLSRIDWDYGSVVFECSAREDMRGMSGEEAPIKLDVLKVLDKDSRVVKRYDFGYGYFNDSYSGSYGQVFKRLKLTDVTDALVEGNKYAFTYNDGELPAKNTRNTDYWGYYNGNPQEAEYYCPAAYAGTSYAGGNKTTVEERMKAGVLTSVRYPTGLDVEYTYEANRYIAAESTTTQTTTQTVTESHTVYQYYSDDFYDYLPSYRSDTLVVDKSTSLQVWGYAESMSCVTDPDAAYGDSDHPVFLISKLGSGSSRTTKHAYTLPVELAGESCSADFARTTLTLAAGTYIVESFAIAKDVWLSFSWTYDKMVTVTTTVPGGETAGGGLRIKRIKAGDMNRTFSYSAGQVLIEPAVSCLLSYSSQQETGAIYTTSYLVQTSESVIPMYAFKYGNSIGYTQVTESVTTSEGTARNIYSYHCMKEETNGDYPFLPTETDYHNGLPVSVEYQKDGCRVKSVSYEYGSDYSHYVHGFMYNTAGGVINSYSCRVESPYITKETVTDYTDNDEGAVSQEKEYTYNGNLQVVLESTQSCGDYYQQKTVYPTDRTDAVSVMMKERNMISLPQERIMLKNGYVIQGQKTEYKDTLGLILPVSEYRLESRTPLPATGYQEGFSPYMAYRHYNTCGKPMQVENRNLSTVYLWSHNGMYPVAEIRNATHAEVSALLGGTFISALLAKSVPSDSDYAAIRALRDTLPHTQVYTYAYSPLVGMTRATNPQGLSVYYSYDAGGRLSESYLMDGSGKRILEHYDYHYKE